MAEINQNAVKLSAALCFWRVFQRCQQRLDIIIVGCLFAGKAGGANARAAVQGIHGQATVVGQRRQASDSRCMAGFDNGILNEGNGRFFGL